jgi:hypothetical protein
MLLLYCTEEHDAYPKPPLYSPIKTDIIIMTNIAFDLNALNIIKGIMTNENYFSFGLYKTIQTFLSLYNNYMVLVFNVQTNRNNDHIET